MFQAANLLREFPQRLPSLYLFAGGVLSSAAISVIVLVSFGLSVPFASTVLDVLTAAASLLITVFLFYRYHLFRHKRYEQVAKISEETKNLKENIDEMWHTLEIYQPKVDGADADAEEIREVHRAWANAHMLLEKAEGDINVYFDSQETNAYQSDPSLAQERLSKAERQVRKAEEAVGYYVVVARNHLW